VQVIRKKRVNGEDEMNINKILYASVIELTVMLLLFLAGIISFTRVKYHTLISTIITLGCFGLLLFKNYKIQNGKINTNKY